MIKTFFIHFAVTLLFIFFYIVDYCVFDACLADDVEFRYGKKRMRNRRKKQKGFWKKFLFLDIRKEVVLWHYVLFWINLFFSSTAIISLNIMIGLESESARIVFLGSFCAEVLTAGIISFVRWHLYIGNKIRNRKNFRRK